MTFLLILKKMVSFGLFRRLPSERTFSKVEIRPQELQLNYNFPFDAMKQAFSTPTKCRASFFKTTFNFRHRHCCKVSSSIGRPMDRRYFNQEATSAIFSKNFSTNFFFRLYFGLFRRLPIRGTIFSEALNSEDFLCNSVL